MYYKLIKSMPKHDIGELLFLNNKDNANFYEWVDSPNYLLPIDIVKDCDEYFELYEIDWRKGEKIFYINSHGDIIEQLFNPKVHLKLTLVKNAFKNKEDAQNFLDNTKKLLNNDIVLCSKENILKLQELIYGKDELKIEKIGHLINLMIK